MKKILILLTILCLKACSLLLFETRLSDLRGKPIQLAFQVFGEPDNYDSMTRGRVYYWVTTGIYKVSSPQVANTTVSGDVSFNMQTHYTSTRMVHGRCIMTIETNLFGMIIDTDVTGYPDAACWEYADALENALYY